MSRIHLSSTAFPAIHLGHTPKKCEHIQVQRWKVTHKIGPKPEHSEFFLWETAMRYLICQVGLPFFPQKDGQRNPKGQPLGENSPISCKSIKVMVAAIIEVLTRHWLDSVAVDWILFLLLTRIEVEAIVEVIVEVLAVTGRRLDIISVIGSDYTSTACSPAFTPLCLQSTIHCVYL